MKKDYIKPEIKKYPVNLSKCMLFSASETLQPSGVKYYNNEVVDVTTQLVSRQDNITDDDEDSDF